MANVESDPFYPGEKSILRSAWDHRAKILAGLFLVFSAGFGWAEATGRLDDPDKITGGKKPSPDSSQLATRIEKVLAGEPDSGRLLAGFRALAQIPRTEFATDWNLEIPFAEALYWMHSEEQTRAAAIEIVRSLNKGELTIVGTRSGLYFPEREDASGTVGTDFVVSTREAGQEILGVNMYYKTEEFKKMPHGQRAEVIAREFSRVDARRSQILQNAANGGNLRDAIQAFR